MTNLRQFSDFADKQVFVGMDVHKKSWSISLFYEDELVKTFNQPPSADALAKFLQREFPGANYVCGYESGFCGFWVQRQLVQRGIDCHVLHAGDIPHTQKRKTAKNDKIDSREIARALSSGMVKSIYIPSHEIESNRLLVRHRDRVQRDIQRCKNRIRGALLQFGYEVPERFSNSWSKKFIEWLKTFDIEQGITRITLNHMIEQLEILRGSFLKVNRDLRLLQESEQYKPLMKLLLTVPGIGPLTAITLITEIADINRFGSFRQLNSFVGIYPMEYSSGEHEYKGSITFRHNRYLRKLLTEAAWIAIRNDPALLLVFKYWEKKMTRKRATIKIARKLLSRIRHVWINETPYIKGIKL